MTAKAILKELKQLLPAQLHGRLDLTMVLAPDMVICMVVHDIIKEVSASEEQEKRICLLIEKLLKIYFNTPKK